MKFIYKIIVVFLSLKRNIKLHRFKKYALCGTGLTVSDGANCICDIGGSIKIGDNCDICGILSCKSKGNLSIGNYTTIRGNSIIGCVNSITIGNYVIISNNVHIYDNNNHPISPLKRVELCKSGFYSNLWNWENSDCRSIIIKDNVWIGERSTILKGVTIGEGSIIGCNSVVTKSVPPFCIAAGNPARIVKRLENDKVATFF